MTTFSTRFGSHDDAVLRTQYGGAQLRDMSSMMPFSAAQHPVQIKSGA
jgi:hypothetical protein